MNDDFSRLVADHLTTEEAKEQRKSLRETVGGIICGLVLAILAVSVTEAYGEEVTLTLQKGDLMIILFDRPCSSEKVLKWLKPGWEKRYKDAQVTLGKYTPEMCWTPFPKDREIWTVYEDGSNGGMPMKLFSQHKGLGV